MEQTHERHVDHRCEPKERRRVKERLKTKQSCLSKDSDSIVRSSNDSVHRSTSLGRRRDTKRRYTPQRRSHSTSSSEEDARRRNVETQRRVKQRIRPDCHRFSGFLKDIVQSRAREDQLLRLAADAKLAQIEFGSRK